jgi:hypothetical protein
MAGVGSEIESGMNFVGMPRSAVGRPSGGNVGSRLGIAGLGSDSENGTSFAGMPRLADGNPSGGSAGRRPGRPGLGNDSENGRNLQGMAIKIAWRDHFADERHLYTHGRH